MRIALIVLLFPIVAQAQWGTNWAHWAKRDVLLQLRSAYHERAQTYNNTTNQDLALPSWYLKRSWLSSLDSKLNNIGTNFFDLTELNTNYYIPDSYWNTTNSSGGDRTVWPYWTWSNLLIYAGATNVTNPGTGEPYFSNYGTNGVLGWWNIYSLEDMEERKAVINALLVTRVEPDGNHVFTNIQYRSGVSNGTSEAIAKAGALQIFETNLVSTSTICSAAANAKGIFTILADQASTSSPPESIYGGMHRAYTKYLWSLTDTGRSTNYDGEVTTYLEGDTVNYNCPQANDVLSFSSNGVSMKDSIFTYNNSTNTSKGDATVVTAYLWADSTNDLTWATPPAEYWQTNYVDGFEVQTEQASIRWNRGTTNSWLYVP